MIYTWFYIFNKAEFEATGLVSREYDVILENIGPKTILVTQGNLFGMTYDDVFLAINLNDENPFEFEDFAVYLDESNDNVFLGILVED